MNACIKTGANVWITSHGHILHGDLYRVGGVYLLRYAAGQAYRNDPQAALEAHALFDDATAEREDNQFGRWHIPNLHDFDGAKMLVIHQIYVRDYLGEQED